jgi:molybdopterin biosynthesis enzyme
MLDRLRLPAITDDHLHRRRDGKTHFPRVVAHTDARGCLRARLAGGQHSHMLHAMAGANALAILPDGEGVPSGGRVELLVLNAETLALPGSATW